MPFGADGLTDSIEATGMQRPFGITFADEGRPGILELRLLFRGPQTNPQRVGWRDVVNTFIRAAQCGAMSGSGIAPAASGCLLEEEITMEREGTWLLRETALDANASTILLNLCHWGHANVSMLERITLCWDRCPGAASMDRAFPLAWPTLSFELREYDLIGQTIAVDLEFDQPQVVEARDQINESIGRWFKAANWSGYADAHFPPPTSTVVIAPEPVTSDSWGLSWYIESYQCSHRVFDGLLNCLERINNIQAPIRRVAIGA
jgi:hypothetical protein